MNKQFLMNIEKRFSTFIGTHQLTTKYFKNSLIIYKENTKEITTVAVVLYVIKPHVYFPKT